MILASSLGASLLLVYPLSASAYQVRSGDSLWSISSRYGVTVSSLIAANGLSGDSLLQIGQHLTIPEHGTSAAVSYHGPTTAYTVQSGDTLWDIAGRYGTSVAALMSVNDLGSNNLQIGQVLRVPGRTSHPPAATASPASVTAPPEVSRGLGPLGRTIGYAMKLQGVPYRWGGTTPAGFDCSGFVQYVFREAGINLPRDTWEQYTVGVPVAKDQLRRGDLVFFNTEGPITHDGIYIGNGEFISATSSDGVAVRNINDGYWGPRYAGGRRL
ncbi:MAG: LysM peptidoglycan-binding domain-containing protein [Peptococcaceae bacterium]|nr:LysM peptidoglycan-binding domain-containing protein [Peptococcaceae bacterium]